MSAGQRKPKTCQRCGRHIGRGDWWSVSLRHFDHWIICQSCLDDFLAWMHIIQKKEVQK